MAPSSIVAPKVWAPVDLRFAAFRGDAFASIQFQKPSLSFQREGMQRWILARLRNRQFFSLAELNQAIRELVDQLNDRPMRRLGRHPTRAL